MSSRTTAGRARGGTGAWHVYVARCADGTLYTGIAKDAQARMARHNCGRGARYTRGRGPVELVYCERVADRSGALKREAEIKRLPAAEKRRLVGGDGRSGDRPRAVGGPPRARR